MSQEPFCTCDWTSRPCAKHDEGAGRTLRRVFAEEAEDEAWLKDKQTVADVLEGTSLNPAAQTPPTGGRKS